MAGRKVGCFTYPALVVRDNSRNVSYFSVRYCILNICTVLIQILIEECDFVKPLCKTRDPSRLHPGAFY